MTKKILLTSNTAWSIYNFRIGLVRTLLEKGYDLYVMAPNDKYVHELEKLGCKFIEIKIDAKSINPFKELMLLRNYYFKIKRIDPDVILSFTIKSNLYAAFSAKILRKPVIVNITGLGDGFTKKSALNTVIKLMYKFSFSKVNTVFFQNDDDKKLFLESNLVKEKVCERLPGSGVDINYFFPMEKKSISNKGVLKFCLISRLLWDKGVAEYVECAKILKEGINNLEFQILGKTEESNRGIPQETINKWASEGYIKYLGFSDDVRQHIREVDCVVLPSYYREGVPRSLIEAAAMGKPIITTDNVGCKEIVDHGVNGYLCKKRDVKSLEFAIREFISLKEEDKETMGHKSREKVLNEFDEKIVIDKYLKKIEPILFH